MSNTKEPQSLGDIFLGHNGYREWLSTINELRDAHMKRHDRRQRLEAMLESLQNDTLIFSDAGPATQNSLKYTRPINCASKVHIK